MLFLIMLGLVWVIMGIVCTEYSSQICALLDWIKRLIDAAAPVIVPAIAVICVSVAAISLAGLLLGLTIGAFLILPHMAFTLTFGDVLLIWWLIRASSKD